MLGGLEHLDGGVFQQFHLRRQVAPVDVARVVDQNVRVAGFLADLRKRVRDGFGNRQVEFHDGAVAALFVDGGLQRRRVGSIAGGQHREETLLGELLGDGSAHAPAHADGQIAVVDFPAVDQLCVAAVGLPFGGRPNHDGDRLAISGHVYSLPYVMALVRNPLVGRYDVINPRWSQPLIFTRATAPGIFAGLLYYKLSEER